MKTHQLVEQIWELTKQFDDGINEKNKSKCEQVLATLQTLTKQEISQDFKNQIYGIHLASKRRFNTTFDVKETRITNEEKAGLLRTVFNMRNDFISASKKCKAGEIDDDLYKLFSKMNLDLVGVISEENDLQTLEVLNQIFDQIADLKNQYLEQLSI